MADITVTVIEPLSGAVASEHVRVTTASTHLHNLSGIAATETERAVTGLIRKIADASAKRSDRTEEARNGRQRDQPEPGSAQPE